MIKNIIFDFGDVFIDLDKEVMLRAIERFGEIGTQITNIQKLNASYEVGKMTTGKFLASLSLG